MFDSMKVNISLKAEISQETTDRVVNFAQRLIGPLAEVGDLFSDKIRYFRFKSAIKTLEKAESIVREREISVKEVPLKFLVPFLEKSSLEEENSYLVDTWAKLLVTAAQEYNSKHVFYTNLLANLGPEEVKTLEIMHKYSDPVSLSYVGKLMAIFGNQSPELTKYIGGIFQSNDNPICYHEEISGFGVTKFGEYIITAMSSVPKKNHKLEDFQLADANLESSIFVLDQLGLVKIIYEVSDTTKDILAHSDGFALKAILSPLGYSFVEACSIKENEIIEEQDG